MTPDPDTQSSPELAAPPASPRERDRLGEWLRSKPAFGLLMLCIGLLMGYFGRPALDAGAGISPRPAVNYSSAVQGPQPLPQSEAEVMPYLIQQTRHFRGSPDAPVTLIEFGDFQCPFCGHYAANAARQIDAGYVARGQVRVGYQHFAFLGSESLWAAEASECAADQSAFWEYHAYLFAHQNGENQGAFARDHLKQFAGELDLDQTTFDQCLDSGKYTALVAGQTQALQALGVQSTPTFIINGTPFVGALDFDAFQQYIEAELLK